MFFFLFCFFFTQPTLQGSGRITASENLISMKVQGLPACKVGPAIKGEPQRSAFLIFILLHNTGSFRASSWIFGVKIVRVFVNKSMPLDGIIWRLQVCLKEAASLQRSACSWALHLARRQVYSPTKGPRGEKRSALGVSQLALVYFPLPSNKRHFLVLWLGKESVIKIPPRGVTERETEPRLLPRPLPSCRMALGAPRCYGRLW